MADFAVLSQQSIRAKADIRLFWLFIVTVNIYKDYQYVEIDSMYKRIRELREDKDLLQKDLVEYLHYTSVDYILGLPTTNINIINFQIRKGCQEHLRFLCKK